MESGRRFFGACGLAAVGRSVALRGAVGLPAVARSRRVVAAALRRCGCPFGFAGALLGVWALPERGRR